MPILSRKPLLVPAGLNVNTCAIWLSLRLISEISVDWVSVLVFCIVPLSSVDAAKCTKRLAAFQKNPFQLSRVESFSFRELHAWGISAAAFAKQKRMLAELLFFVWFFFFFFNPTCLWRSDDRTEETEAADWPVGTTCAHEHQPPAACISSWTERAQLTLTECEHNLKR